MQHFLDTILNITEQAEAIPKRYFRQGVTIDQKQDETPVTIADRATEESIRAVWPNIFPITRYSAKNSAAPTATAPISGSSTPLTAPVRSSRACRYMAC